MTWFLAALFLGFSFKSFVICYPFPDEIPYGEIPADFWGMTSEYSELKFRTVQTPQKNETIARLPENTFPLSYDIRIIVPDLQTKRPNFTGEVTIKIWVQESTNKIVLHSDRLSVGKIRIWTLFGSEKPCTFKLDPVNQLLIITVESNYLETGSPYNIRINYNGTVNERPTGFFKTCYKKGSTYKCLAATQMEPTNARTMLPCYDEPDKKATFSMAIAAYNNQTVLSNMPLLKKSEPDPTIGNRVWNIFNFSSPMSTYLVAFFVSDDYAQISNAQGNFSVWTRKDVIADGRYALDEGLQVYREMKNSSGGVDIKLPKMDMVALPELHVEAMENLGLITFIENNLLYNKETYSTRMKQTTIYAVAHEISHHWFGNYVTMPWWDDLWLKEGFATYYEYFATHRVKSDWRMDELFVIEIMHPALSVDGIKLCQPMSSPVNTNAELKHKYNIISYYKGAAIVRMMKHFMPESVFVKGVERYLTLGHYLGGVASPEILWHAIESTMKEEGIMLEQNVNFTSTMEHWTTTCGYPLIIITRIPNGTRADIQISQITYTSSSSKFNVPDQNWTVPITCTKRSVSNFNHTQPVLWSIGKQNMTLKREVEKNEWILCNIQQTGFYRVLYDDGNYQLLGKYLSNHSSQIPPLDKAQLVNDLFTHVENDRIDFRLLFQILGEYLPEETDVVPWFVALPKLWDLQQKHAATSVGQALQNFTGNCIKAVYRNISFYEKPTDTDLTKMFRSKMVTYACQNGNSDCISKAKQEYKKSRTLSDINPDIKFAVSCTMLLWSNISHEVFDKIRNLTKTSNVPQEKQLIFKVAGCMNCKELMKKYWYIALEDPEKDPYRMISSLASSVNGVIAILECIGEIMTNYSQYQRGQEVLSFSIECVKWKGASQEHTNLLNELLSNSTKLDKQWLTKALNETKEQVVERKQKTEETAMKIAEALGVSVTTEAPTTRRPSSAAIPVTPAIIIHVLVFITTAKNTNIFKILIY